jgi:hypothetical protein
MKYKFILIGLALVLGLASVSLLLGMVSHQAQAMSIIPTWKQVGGDGLGDTNNHQIPSLAVFGDYLYAGTQHYDGIISATAQIWRTSTGKDWEMVDERPVNAAGAMIAFNGSIYAGSWDGYVWSSPNGITWTEVITNGFDGSGNGIAHFAVFSDTLYAGTWSWGAKIWRTIDGKNWLPFVDDGAGDMKNYGTISSEIFDGYLYWGVDNWTTGAQLWRTDGITNTAIITGGFGNPGNLAISSLALYRNSLYAGVYNVNGIQVWRSTNGTVWMHVTDFVHPGEAKNALEVFNEQLYLVVENDATGLEVWRTSNGTDWAQVGFDGFGDANNQSSYWDNAMTIFKDKLYLAARNWPTGGEVWQMTHEYKTCLPFVRVCQKSIADDFSDPNSGWPVESETDYSMNYVANEYQMTVNPGWIAWATWDFEVNDYIVEVDSRAAANLDGGMGIFFGATKDGFYLFEVSDGWYSLWRNDSGSWTWTALIDWTFSPTILPRYQTNHLKVERAGPNITVYANGQMLGAVSDGTYTGTSVGLAVEAYSAYFDGRFDNFALSSTGCLSTEATTQLFNHGASFESILNKLEK